MMILSFSHLLLPSPFPFHAFNISPSLSSLLLQLLTFPPPTLFLYLIFLAHLPFFPPSFPSSLNLFSSPPTPASISFFFSLIFPPYLSVFTSPSYTSTSTHTPVSFSFFLFNISPTPNIRLPSLPSALYISLPHLLLPLPSLSFTQYFPHSYHPSLSTFFLLISTFLPSPSTPASFSSFSLIFPPMPSSLILAFLTLPQPFFSSPPTPVSSFFLSLIFFHNYNSSSFNSQPFSSSPPTPVSFSLIFPLYLLHPFLNFLNLCFLHLQLPLSSLFNISPKTYRLPLFSLFNVSSTPTILLTLPSTLNLFLPYLLLLRLLFHSCGNFLPLFVFFFSLFIESSFQSTSSCHSFLFFLCPFVSCRLFRPLVFFFSVASDTFSFSCSFSEYHLQFFPLFHLLFLSLSLILPPPPPPFGLSFPVLAPSYFLAVFQYFSFFLYPPSSLFF
ncbi:unnamed protein product [Acanthosepion pharaonis]|uniref:Uncharacterized protein n=1 Tax=Acanthosepion pharaonis TaxID=158019 RepID=A0A812BQL4_ACAPH|nr:unnamed protein product [Sepia pharaonis]